MNRLVNQDKARYANGAVLFLLTGLSVVIVTAAGFYDNFVAAVIGVILSVGLQGVALILGILGRQHVRGQNAVAGSIFLILLSPLVIILVYICGMLHVLH